MKHLLILFGFIGVLMCNCAIGQVEEKPYGYNVIKFNPTPMLLWNTKNITFSYERIFKNRNHQSISIMAGYLELPSIAPVNILNWAFIRNGEKFGINLCADYRFYLKHQNRKPAPNGVYLSVFTSYYGQSNTIDMILGEDRNVTSQMNIRFNAFNVGGALGYQFVLFKHFTIDFCLLGPSISYYTHNIDFSAKMDAEEQSNLRSGIWNHYSGRYPLLRAFLKGEEISDKSSHSALSAGFRYCIQIGYHF